MEVLQNSRNAILREINQRQGSPHTNNTDNNHLTHLKQQYNQTVEAIATARTSPLRDPLRYLPTELWEDIVERVAHSSLLSPTSWLVDNLLHLCCISSQWEKAILRTARFWSTIDVDSNMHDLEAKLITCLTLSAGLPIYLTLSFPLPTEKQFLQSLLKERHRIKSMELHSSLLTQEQVQETITSFGDFPLLESIDCVISDGLDYRIDSVFQHPQNLKSLAGVEIPRQILESASLKRLQHLTTYGDLQNYIPFFHILPCLRIVHCPETSYDLHPNSGTDITPRLAGDLPWNEFHVSRRTSGVDSILARTYSTLVDLELLHDIYWANLPQLLLLCNQMKLLKNLRLAIFDDGKSVFNIPSQTLAGGCRISQLSIRFRNTGFGMSKVGLAIGNIELLFSLLPTFAPKTRDLTLTTNLIRTPTPAFIKDLPSLQILDLTTLYRGTFRVGAIKHLHLERLRVRGLGALLNSIHSPNVTRLIYINTAHIYTVGPNVSQWSKLRVLKVNSDIMDWKGVSLPCLEKMTLGSSYNNVDYASSSFYVELASHPTAFPRLRYIKMSTFIEWDIIFLMLERRNFLIGEDVSRIAAMAFPALPPPILLHPLCARLRGQFSERPSNFALSLQGCAEVYMDPDNSSCGNCMRTFLPCDYRKENRYMSVGTRKPLFDLGLPPYPSTVDEILSTCQARNAAWCNVVSTRLGHERPIHCGRHYSYSLTKVTGLTTFGLPEPSEHQYRWLD